MAKKNKPSPPSLSAEPSTEHSSANGGSGWVPTGAPPDHDLAPSPVDSRERIAARAYELYLKRGAGQGDATEDWLAAERELSKPSGNGSPSSNGH